MGGKYQVLAFQVNDVETADSEGFCPKFTLRMRKAMGTNGHAEFCASAPQDLKIWEFSRQTF